MLGILGIFWIVEMFGLDDAVYGESVRMEFRVFFVAFEG